MTIERRPVDLATVVFCRTVEGDRLLAALPVAVAHVFGRIILARCLVGGIGFRRRLIALQERVALELRLDEHAQLDVGQLKQTNSLLQLGCHHQLLALPQLQLRRKHHSSPDRRQDVSRGQGITTPH